MGNPCGKKISADWFDSQVNIRLYLELDQLVSSLMDKNSEGVWACSTCEYSSSSKNSVKEHVESRHVETQSYPCNICGYVCPTRKALKMHIFRNKHLC